MKTACDTNHSGRTVWATILLSFWFLIVGVPAFCAAIPVDVLWAGMFDNSGQPLEGGKVYTYTAGTTASKTTYIDSAKVTPAANPIVLDAYGRAQVYADGAYKFVIKNSDDVTLITIDNLEYVSSQNPSTLNTTTFSASSATIGSITALLGTLVNMTISSATITLANIVSPNISNASMTGALYSPSVTNGTFTGGIFNGGTISPATFTLPANATVATPTVATAYVNKGYVDAALSTFSGVQYFKADPYPATGATTLFTTVVAPSGVEQAVTGMSFALSNTSTTATRTYLITGSYLVRMLSTDTMELLKMDFRDDLGNSYDTVYAQMMNNVYDVIGYTYSYTACKTAAYVQIGPSTTRTFYLYQEPATATATYHVFGKTDLADAFRIVGW